MHNKQMIETRPDVQKRDEIAGLFLSVGQISS